MALYDHKKNNNKFNNKLINEIMSIDYDVQSHACIRTWSRHGVPPVSPVTAVHELISEA